MSLVRPLSALAPGLVAVLVGCGPVDAGENDAGDVGTPDAGEETVDAGTPVDAFQALLCDEPAPRADTRPLPPDVLSAAPTVELRATVGHVEVWGKPSLTLAKATDWGGKACEAYAWNSAELGLQKNATLLRTPVRVVVLDRTAYAAATDAPGTYGVTLWPQDDASDALVLPDVVVGDALDFLDTLSHELVHIAQGRVAPTAELPQWAVEGQAVHLGARYVKATRGVPSAYVPGYVDRADGASVDFTFRVYDVEDLTQDLGEVGEAQAVSGFFIEWMRTDAATGASAGLASVHRELLEIMASVESGTAFTAAFESVLPIALDDAKAGFRAFIEETDGRLDLRYAGTVFEDGT